MKNAIFFSALFMFYGCSLFPKEVCYKHEYYSIEDSEFGVAFIKNNGIEYYIHEEIYEFNNQFYANISGSQDKGDRWVFIRHDGYVGDVDSTKINFSKCKKYGKRKLLEL